MKNLLLLPALFLCMATAWAQPKFNFSKEGHDFGEVPEGKMASHDYEFVNTGDQPLIISNVQASCGCTTPFWTKEPIMPGKSGTIKASFNSQGRPGNFSKSITVTSNAVEGTKMLTFKGVVIAKGALPTITDEMKATSATISYDKTEVKLGKLEPGQTAVARFNVTNKGKSKLEIYDVTSTTFSTTWLFSKPSLAPGETGTLEVTYRTPNKPGDITEGLQVTSSDYNNYFSKLSLKATVKEVVPQSSVIKSSAAVPFK
jgi:hypothetical protein